MARLAKCFWMWKPGRPKSGRSPTVFCCQRPRFWLASRLTDHWLADLLTYCLAFTDLLRQACNFYVFFWNGNCSPSAFNHSDFGFTFSLQQDAFFTYLDQTAPPDRQLNDSDFGITLSRYYRVHLSHILTSRPLSRYKSHRGYILWLSFSTYRQEGNFKGKC